MLCIWKTFHCNPLEFPHLIILVYNDVFRDVSKFRLIFSVGISCKVKLLTLCEKKLLNVRYTCF